MSLLFPQINCQVISYNKQHEQKINELNSIKAEIEQLIEERFKEVSRIADPDPYNLHNIPIETRLAYIERYLIEGY